MENIIPLFGMLIGVIIPVSVFTGNKEGKEKNKNYHRDFQKYR